MTLGTGNHLAKIKQAWVDGKTEFVYPAQVVEGEAYHEFEIVALYGSQGDPNGFSVVLKLIK